MLIVFVVLVPAAEADCLHVIKRAVFFKRLLVAVRFFLVTEDIVTYAIIE